MLMRETHVEARRPPTAGSERTAPAEHRHAGPQRGRRHRRHARPRHRGTAADRSSPDGSRSSSSATARPTRRSRRRAARSGRTCRARSWSSSTNAGSHAAIRCGLTHARGEHVAIMAADGQDPPEALPGDARRDAPGLDVVWGRRRDRANDGAAARWLGRRLLPDVPLLTGLDYPPSGLDFLVARRRVVDAVLARSARNTSLFLLIYNLGFPQAFVDYERGARSRRLARAGRCASGSSSPSTC